MLVPSLNVGMALGAGEGVLLDLLLPFSASIPPAVGESCGFVEADEADGDA